MAKTVEQLIAEFKVENLDQNFLNALRSEITEAHSQLATATNLKTEAERAKAEAIAERARIDKAILEMGDGTLNATRLKAQNKAYKAIVDSLKEDGLSIDLPEDIFKETPEAQPNATGGIPKEMKDQLALVGQAIAAADVAARYVGIYGKPIPMDMQTMVTTAQRMGKPVQQWADETFHLTDEMKKRNDAAEAQRLADLQKQWEADYKKAHPVVRENHDLRPGLESRFADLPKIKREEPSKTREYAGLSDMEKLRRSKEHAREMIATQLQEN